MSLTNLEELTAIALFGIGFTLLLLDRNLIKKILGFSMTDSGIYLFLAARGYVAGRTAPIVTEGVQAVEAYVNPIPAGLVLTGIVVSVASTAVLLALKEYNGSDKVQVQWIYHARDEKWKQNVVGLTMSALPIAIDFSRPGLDLLKEIRMQIAENIAWSDLSFALYDNSPGLQENLNIILEEGMVEDAAITPGTQDINLWGYRHTTPEEVECVLIPVAKENRLIMFINYNRCCYEEASMQRFCEYVADCMRRLIG